ncbi:hypothetical protein BDW68DRAFT_183768 [Aspergillus falconensis]
MIKTTNLPTDNTRTTTINLPGHGDDIIIIHNPAENRTIMKEELILEILVLLILIIVMAALALQIPLTNTVEVTINIYILKTQMTTTNRLSNLIRSDSSGQIS